MQWGQASEKVEEGMVIYHVCLLRRFPQIIASQFCSLTTYLQNLDIITEVLKQDCYICLTSVTRSISQLRTTFGHMNIVISYRE